MPAEKEQTIAMSPADLQALISAAVTAAVKEGKKPYVDEAYEAAKADGREKVHAEEMERLANTKAVQDRCPHLDENENYAFAGQFNCLGQLMFLCKTCLKTFLPDDPDYRNLVRFVKQDKLGRARQ